ncbi:hypothetical protein ACFV6E_42165 [Streptomyces sp. NPDC059785]|uniref:hypothetical protein n=1 Tax=unclassified Streptomyces TaxID=2593676 RepID=UPI00364B2079
MRWRERAVWVRWVAAVQVLGFLEGTGAHAYFVLAGGRHAYDYASPPVRLVLHALLLLDPLTALLLLGARASGALLAAVVMLADLAGNWSVAWNAVVARPGEFLRPVGLLPITVFGLFVLLTALPLYRALATLTWPDAAPDARLRKSGRVSLDPAREMKGTGIGKSPEACRRR